ncbi:MAG: type II toxin-antitoxin system VapC family toxin [Aeromicrobium sp.]
MIVVDCSAILDALVGRDAEPVHDVLVDERCAAPTVIDYEVLSALRGLVRGRRLSPHAAHDALSDLDQLPVERWHLAEPLRRRVFDLRANLTAYDAAYVVLAESLDCALLTRDRKLASAAGRLVDVTVV